jgi:hypothetical protein
MHGPINVKSPNNTNKWQMGFNSGFKGLTFTMSYSFAEAKSVFTLNFDISIKFDIISAFVSIYIRKFFFFLWRCDPTRVTASSFLRFLDPTQRRTTVGRTPLDESSARRRHLYLTTHNTLHRQTSMPIHWIRTYDLSRWAAVDLRLRPRGHWDRLYK